MTAVLELRGITKRFGATVALDDVTLDLQGGSVEAIVGHNGAGKSTLMRILNGEIRPDEGEVVIDGQRVELGDPTDAARHGIAAVHQEITLCPHLTVLENMFIGHEQSRAGLLDWRRMRANAAELLELLNLEHVRDVPTGDLDVAHQQLTEIARALLTNPRILILDEPNSALTERESEELFARARTLRARGHLVIYISHRLREVRDLADSIIVMREGRVVDRVAPSTPVSELARLLLGDRGLRAVTGEGNAPSVPDLTPAKGTGPALAVRAWTDRNGAFRDISLDVPAGEVLGIGGVEGSGHRELVRSLAGLSRARGRLEVGGAELRRPDIGRLLARGVAYLSPDRGSKSLFQSLTVERNLGVGVVERWSTFGFLRPGRLREMANQQVETYGITGRPELPVSSLSGGNQQKVALARLIAIGPQVLLLEEPTRGVDVGAKAEIYALLRQLRDAGTAIVLTTPELDELVDLCDRVVVLAGGVVRAELSGDALTEAALLEAAAATGQAA